MVSDLAFRRADAVEAKLLALEVFVQAAVETVVQSQPHPRKVAELIGDRARRDAERIRKKDRANAAIVLPMEDAVHDLCNALAISVAGERDTYAMFSERR